MASIVIQQTLHGYSDGHRLLSGSIKFSDELARIVLRMSDLSGSNVVPGFEEYLTGYSLKSAPFYAFAKTWYASEMPRPGCVWTHTLFIPVKGLDTVPDLQSLSGLFLRPQSAKHFTGFSKAIQFEIEQMQNELVDASNVTGGQLADLVETIYRQNRGNVLIGSQNSRSYETALMRFWSQQWPQLRKSFTFCTGGLSARGFGGKPFDVQCSPASLVRGIIGASVSKQSQEMTLLIKASQDQPSWCEIAARDAESPTGGRFRQLLWAFADAPDLRLYKPAAQLIDKVLSLSECSVEEMIDFVAEIFPSRESGNGVKSALFGSGGGVPGFGRFDEGQILVALATTAHNEAFDSEALLLKARASELCSRNVESARQIISRLFRSAVNPLGEDILVGMIESMNPDLARAVTAEHPQFLATLFRAKPELGMSPELWVAGGDRKRELLEALTSQSNLADDLIERVGVALLESNSEFLLIRALEKWGQPIVFGILEWLKGRNGGLSERSIGALTLHVETIVKWILAQETCPQRVVIAAAHIIAPYTGQFRECDANIWLKTFRELVKQGDQREANYFAAMILAQGLQNTPPVPLTLVEESFERVHQLAWDDAIPNDTWFILDSIVPHLWWHRDWDKCERLRRGLIEAFVKFRWPRSQLANCVKNEAVFSRIIESAKSVDGGRELASERF